jgi:EAL domain-containing protein (putative c-di-GMP-specific phosphodiesterase class I)
MAYFKRLPADELKIDKSFVLNLLENPMDMHIAKSIIAMAQGFGLQVVAEGIENKETYLKLQQMGCNVGQGYYVSKALAQQDFIDWMQQYSPVSQSMASKPAN